MNDFVKQGDKIVGNNHHSICFKNHECCVVKELSYGKPENLIRPPLFKFIKPVKQKLTGRYPKIQEVYTKIIEDKNKMIILYGFMGIGLADIAK